MHSEIPTCPVSPGEVEAALRAHPSVEDCVVLSRATAEREAELVAYVVPSGPFVPERLEAHLQAALPGVPLPGAYVPVAALPLTPSGQCDEAALTQLAVIDEDLVRRWEERLQALAEVEHAAVVIQECAEVMPPLHLADLLPGWKVAPAVAAEVAPSAARLAPGPQVLQSGRPSISVGELLPEDPDRPTTLPVALRRAATERPDQGVRYVQADGTEIFQSYPALLEEAERILAGLRQLGLKPQDKVLFQLDLNQDFIPAFWGCVLGGFVPVPISIPPTYDQVNATVSKLHNAWLMLDRPVVLTGTKLAPAVHSLAGLLSLEDFRVVVVDELRAGAPDRNWHPCRPDDLVVILFTSGSTGKPKGVMQCHRSVLNRSASTAQRNGFGSADVSVNWFPLDHVGGIVMFHIRDVYLRCQQIHVPTQAILRDPLQWLDLINRFRATVTWAPNFAYGLVNAKAEEIARRRWDLSSMRFILNAGEAIVAKTVRRFLELLAPHGLPPTAMRPAWGMSETSSAVTFSDLFALDTTSDEDLFVEVGAPLPEFALRIVEGQNRVVEEGKIGCLQVKGPTVTSGYFQNPELNREVFTKDGWFNTGDLGMLRNGRLTITGRQKDVIIINGVNFHSHEIEAVVEEVAGVAPSFTAACAVREPGKNTDDLAIFFHAAQAAGGNLAALIKEIRGRVVRNVGVNPTYLIPVAKQAIPKTEIGKIQRTQLRNRFEAGEFDAVLKQVDIQTENANTLPDWFLRRVWRSKEARPAAAPPSGSCLVFMDRLGLGATLCEELERFDQPCVRVEPGTGFARLGPEHYCINPKEPGHYRRLLESIAADHPPIGRVLHLWTYDAPAGAVSSVEALEEAQHYGVYSLLDLVHALPQIQGAEHPIQLLVVSSLTQPTAPKDELVYAHSAVHGLTKTMALELPSLDCRHVDLSAKSVAADADCVLGELESQGDPEVAYRRGQRLVPRLAKVDLTEEPARPLPFKAGGFYVISGGLGGIGVELARYLLQQHQARLLLLGRTPLPERSSWQSHLGHQDAVAERIAAYQSLEQLPGAVRYEAVDITDPEPLRQVVERVAADWGAELEGIIHLAGTHRERFLADETRESLAAILRPKMQGTWALHQLVKDRPGALFLGFSSVMSFLGGSMFGAYAAANRFLDCFAHYQRHQFGLRSHCFAWSAWTEVGMSRSRDGKEPLRARGRGIQDLSVKQGLNSLLAGLHRGQELLVVGLDATRPFIQRNLEPAPLAVQQLCAYFSARTHPLPIERLEALEVRDRFQTRSTCEFLQLPALPLTETGAIDRAGLARGHRGTAEWVAPRTDVERRIAAIWQEVLGVPRIGVHDNFFELGGQSILATMVIARLQGALQVEVPLRALFEAPTVAGLAESIDVVRQSGPETSAPPLVPARRTGDLPLSFAQQRLWFIDQLEPNSSSYNCFAAVRLTGPLQVKALEQSLEAIACRHESLRTTFPARGGRPVQVIAPAGPWRLPVLDLSHRPAADREAEARRLGAEEAQRPFDLTQGPLWRTTLVRLSEQEHVLLVNMHHIISDGWSLVVFNRELAALYEAFLSGRPASLAEMPIQFADYAVWQRDWLQGEVLQTQLSYWKRQLQGAPTLLELPADRPRPPVQSFKGAHLSFKLPQDLSERIKALSQQEGATLFMTLMAAFQALMGRYSGQEQLIVSTGVANRNRRETEPLIGCLINILLLRTDLSGNPTFRELLGRVREVALGAYAHQDVPFEKLVEELQPQRDLSYNPLTQVMFVLLKEPITALALPGLRSEPVDVESNASQYDLVLHMWETPEGLAGVFDYNTDLFEATTIARMVSHFQTLLEGVATEPEGRFLDLPLLTSEERHQMLIEWNDTRKDFPEDRCLHELFELQAARAPDAVAVFFGDEQLTYGELERRANQLGHYLRKLGVGPDVLVGLSVERSFEMVVGILGIMKSGGAYVPLDPSYPQERLHFMLRDTRAPVLLTQQQLLPRMADCPARIICLDGDWKTIARERTDRPASGVGPQHLGYVIYTSGSTGTPKGIAIRHQGVLNNIVDLNWRHGVGPQDRMLALSSLSFDMCVYEVFGTLEAGGAIVMPTMAALREPAQWAQLMRQHRVTIWNSAPALLRMLVDYVADRPDLWPRHLHLAILGGDWIPVTLPDRLKAMAPRVRFIALGGATEASIHSIIYEVHQTDPRWKSIPYGRPQYNQKAYILNPRLQPQPVGVAGELYLGGIGLARGYYGRPDLTAERFLPNPFATEPAERIYKTGDLARYLPDGNIELLGRMDFQVKLRGLRIECGEIEALIRRHPGVREGVVTAKEFGNDKRLVAYIRPNLQAASPEVARSSSPERLIEVLRGFLEDKLPDYMVPSAFVLLDNLPLSPNGKVDRKALPIPEMAPIGLERGSAPPRTSVEEILAGIWAEVLGVAQVGVEDNFFNLGGHSLLATQVISKVREACWVELPLRSVFEAPTVAGLASAVEAARQAGQGPQAPPMVRAPRDSSAPLSFAQQRLWFIDQLLPGNFSYNIPFTFRLEGDLNRAVLERSLGEIVRRHEALRTTFAEAGGQPVQVIGPAVPLALRLVDVQQLTGPEQPAEVRRLVVEEAERPFDLARGPLLRVCLIRLGVRELFLAVTMHHIVSDGWSLSLFSRELTALYEAFATGRPSPLLELPIQYPDYAVWQRNWLQGDVLERHAAYWKQQVAGAPTKLELPADHVRPPVQTLRGARSFFTFPAVLADQARAVSQREGTTLFMTLLGAFKTFLYAYTDQEDLVVGSPFANRTQSQTEGLIGAFVNTLVLRTQLSGNPTFREVLRRVREVILGADDHQDFPFEKIVEVVRPPRDPSRNPLFQVNFRVVTAPPPPLELTGLTPSPLEITDFALSKFDLALEFWIDGDGFGGFFEYSTDLFEEATIRRMGEDLEQLLGALFAQPDTPLGDLDLLQDVVRRRRTREEGKVAAGSQSRAKSLRNVRRKAVDLSPAGTGGTNGSKA